MDISLNHLPEVFAEMSFIHPDFLVIDIVCKRDRPTLVFQTQPHQANT